MPNETESYKKFMEMKKLLLGRKILNIYTDDESGILVSFSAIPGYVDTQSFIIRISAIDGGVLSIDQRGPIPDSQRKGFVIEDPPEPKKIVQYLREWKG